MNEKIVVLDFGSQYTQLIARRLRELQIYTEIHPYSHEIKNFDGLKAIIFSGSPFSVLDENALKIDLDKYLGKVPILGICYGAQLIADEKGGEVMKSNKREYGKAKIHSLADKVFFDAVEEDSQVWMSHGDTIKHVPHDFEIIAETSSIPVAAFKSIKGRYNHPVYCIQFHPEVTHSLKGSQILRNFAIDIAGCKQEWTPQSYVEETVAHLKAQIGEEHVLLGLSGGVDSSVAACLLQKAIGENLICFFIDNGLLRKDEYEEVLKSYEGMGLNIKGIRAGDRFVSELKGVSEPEKKRKIIGRVFIEVFQEEAAKIEEVEWLGQGTIYPDVIESVSVHGPSATIKSHHNVGGLPEKLHLKIVEPLRMLFKDEVRKVGAAVNLPDHILHRHPFPGPGLGIRILGAVDEEKIRLTQEADYIFIQALKDENLYDEVWQALAVLLPVQSVGVMGDERTYEYTVALRSVNSVDGMTAEWSHLPHDFLARVSSKIINQVKGINRVVYDISTKPPATIEWE
jgi:GMP synthase (glutamine-hydrolysing)